MGTKRNITIGDAFVLLKIHHGFDPGAKLVVTGVRYTNSIPMTTVPKTDSSIIVTVIEVDTRHVVADHFYWPMPEWKYVGNVKDFFPKE